MRLAVVLLLGVAAAAAAQETTGTIEGVVSDGTDRTIGGARITARHLDSGLVKEATAATDGFFRLLLLPIGDYSVVVEAPQFATLAREPIAVSVSQAQRGVRLQPDHSS